MPWRWDSAPGRERVCEVGLLRCLVASGLEGSMARQPRGVAGVRDPSPRGAPAPALPLVFPPHRGSAPTSGKFFNPVSPLQLGNSPHHQLPRFCLRLALPGALAPFHCRRASERGICCAHRDFAATCLLLISGFRTNLVKCLLKCSDFSIFLPPGGLFGSAFPFCVPLAAQVLAGVGSVVFTSMGAGQTWVSVLSPPLNCC